MASQTADAPETSDLGSSSSSTNERASYTKISTAVLMTKTSADPLRFVRASGSATPAAVTKTPPSSVVKSPSVNRKRQDSQNRKETPRWEDDGSSEWRDSFSNWVGKRKGTTTVSTLGAQDYTGSAVRSQNDFQGTQDDRVTYNGDNEPPSFYQSTPTWKRATDETSEDERWDSGSECNTQSIKNSSLDKPAPPENVNTYQLVDSVDLHSSPARMHNAPARTEAADVTQTALNTSTPTHQNVRSQNVQAPMARADQQEGAQTDDRPNDESEERCLSVRDALKKYSTQIGTTPAPPPVRPKPTPNTRASFGKSDAVNNSSRQQPARTHSQMAARTDETDETITQRSALTTQLGTANPTERETVEMDELTGLRKVSQFLNSMQQDIAYAGSTPAPAYSNDYRPSASPRSDTAYSDKMQENFDDETETREASEAAPPSTEQDQEKVVGSVSADQACAGCAKHLEAGAAMYIEKLRSVFHIHCFRCSICRDSLVIRQRCVNREYGDEDDEDDLAADALTTVTVFIRDSKLLCGACFERLPKQHSPH